MLFQLIHIINLCTLLFSTTGLLVHQHYCQDELKVISFYTDTIQDCCKKNKQQQVTKSCDTKSPQIHKKSCCKDKTIYSVDNSVEQNSIVDDGIVSIWSLDYVPMVPDVMNFVAHQRLIDICKQLRYYSYKAPPDKTPIHILFCSFRC